jgi:hypothetical protein
LILIVLVVYVIAMAVSLRYCRSMGKVSNLFARKR